MKLMKVVLTVLVMAAMVAPAVAEDRLKLSGEMRVRAWVQDFDNEDSEVWADQRLRIGGNIAVAEGVSVTFRTDITETNWGAGGSAYGAGRMASTQQWDRAHLDLTSGNFHLRAGQQYVGLGLTQVANSQDAGLSFDVKGAVPVKGFFLLDNDLGKTVSDALFYGIGIAPKGDNFASDFFAAGYTDGSDEQVYVLGADLTLNLSAVKLQGELDYFFGDATSTEDAMGLQLFLDGSIAASDAATFGAQFYYAQAADAGEVQYQALGNDFNGWDPIMDVGTNLSNEQIGLGRPFDFTGDSAGVVGGRLYGNFKLSDAVKLGASVAYLTPEEDANSTIDDVTSFAVGMTYAVMANTSLHAQVQYSDIDDTDVLVTTDQIIQAGVGLYVNF